MKKVIYRFYWDCGRSGSVEGIFVADEKYMQEALGKDVYFGEILGKHSEIHGKLEEGDIEALTSNQIFIRQFMDILGEDFCVGYNPLDYIEEEEDDDIE